MLATACVQKSVRLELDWNAAHAGSEYPWQPHTIHSFFASELSRQHLESQLRFPMHPTCSPITSVSKIPGQGKLAFAEPAAITMTTNICTYEAFSLQRFVRTGSDALYATAHRKHGMLACPLHGFQTMVGIVERNFTCRSKCRRPCPCETDAEVGLASTD